MRIPFLLTVLLTTTVVAGQPTAAVTREADLPLSISLSVPKRGGERRIDFDDSRSHFHVIVTNNSKSEQRVWETCNSWGDRNLRFEVLGDKGAVTHVITKKEERDRRVNYPSWIPLAPGETLVMDVYFSPLTWDMPFLSDVPDSPGNFKLKLRAVLEVESEEAASKNAIWTGKIQSKVDDVTIGVWSNWIKSPITKR
ncbi:MAG: hypothetical protein WKF77_30925 [Planctomycetaceae bacterium]